MYPNQENIDNQELEESSIMNFDNYDNDINSSYNKTFGTNFILFPNNEDDDNYNEEKPYFNQENITKENKGKSEKKTTEIENYNTTIMTPVSPNFDEKNLNKKKKKSKDKNDFLGKKQGRKSLNELNDEDDDEEKEEGHNKYSEDNIMRKIKTNIMDYSLNKLNNSLKNKAMTFLKIDKKLSENLKKDFNMDLMNRTLQNILYNESMRKKYKRKNYDNKKLIDEIIKENKELETIEILNKTYYDMIVEIRQQNLNAFLDKIVKKENNMKKKSNIDEYIDLLKDLLFRFKEWFDGKKGRKREQNKNENKDLLISNLL